MIKTHPTDNRPAIGSEITALRAFGKRSLRIAVVLAFALGLVIADAMTWLQLDIAAIYGLPVVLAAATRQRWLLWFLTASLAIATFAVYALQIPAGTFSPHEAFFINRVLDVVSLLVIAVLLHVWMNEIDKSEALVRLLNDQKEKLDSAKVSRRLVEIQKAERREIANGLHDLVGQKLATLSLNLNIVKAEVPPSTGSKTRARIEDSLTLVEETSENIRDVMASLRPAVLDDYGLMAALHWYVEQFTKRTGIVTTAIEQGSIRRPPRAVEEAFFRIAQEALANVVKYAGARNVSVKSESAAQGICLTIADDGIGFDPAAPRTPARDHGWGLMIMREHATGVGAKLRVDAAPGCGTKVIVTLDGDYP